MLKLVILMLSTVTTIVCIVGLNKLPNNRYTKKVNDNLRILFTAGSIILDTILIWVIAGSVPEGEYGTGVEVVMAIVVTIILTPIYIATEWGITKRSGKNNAKSIFLEMGWDYVFLSLVSKNIFIIMMTIWIVEVK